MDIITLLRKLGILRFGVKKYKYTSGRDMPAEALLDDVYDAEKDLVTKEDFKRVFKKGNIQNENQFCSHCGVSIDVGDKFCPQCGTEIK